MKPARPKKAPLKAALSLTPEEQAFGEVVEMIQAARVRTLAAVNTALIDLYWQVGQSISRRIDNEGWGKNTVVALAAYI